MPWSNSSARDDDGFFLEWPSSLLSQGYLFTGQRERAEPILQGLLTKFPKNEFFRKDAQTLSRIVIHQPRRINNGFIWP